MKKTDWTMDLPKMQFSGNDDDSDEEECALSSDDEDLDVSAEPEDIVSKYSGLKMDRAKKYQ
jgi:hypothetical protein